MLIFRYITLAFEIIMTLALACVSKQKWYDNNLNSDDGKQCIL